MPRSRVYYYYYVVSALDQDAAQRLIDLLDNPPEDNKYTTLKERLLDTFKLLENERAARLLNMPNLGDRTLSALMDEMMGLLGHLPEDIRTISAAETYEHSQSLAQRADILRIAHRDRTNNRSNTTASSATNQASCSIFFQRREGRIVLLSQAFW